MTKPGPNRYQVNPGEIVTFDICSENFASLVAMDPLLNPVRQSNFCSTGTFTIGNADQCLLISYVFPQPVPANADYKTTIRSGGFQDGPLTITPPSGLSQADIAYCFVMAQQAVPAASPQSAGAAGTSHTGNKP
jgi:hypothetical protein